ncbi:unnamed protein product [Amoebophrya sp. A120]|nr:unnamed protein product [Amoebophrya sp. A120]|eukprot:GSA120T00022328001.1
MSVDRVRTCLELFHTWELPHKPHVADGSKVREWFFENQNLYVDIKGSCGDATTAEIEKYHQEQTSSSSSRGTSSASSSTARVKKISLGPRKIVFKNQHIDDLQDALLARLNQAEILFCHVWPIVEHALGGTSTSTATRRTGGARGSPPSSAEEVSSVVRESIRNDYADEEQEPTRQIVEGMRRFRDEALRKCVDGTHLPTAELRAIITGISHTPGVDTGFWQGVSEAIPETEFLPLRDFSDALHLWLLQDYDIAGEHNNERDKQADDRVNDDADEIHSVMTGSVTVSQDQSVDVLQVEQYKAQKASPRGPTILARTTTSRHNEKKNARNNSKRSSTQEGDYTKNFQHRDPLHLSKSSISSSLKNTSTRGDELRAAGEEEDFSHLFALPDAVVRRTRRAVLPGGSGAFAYDDSTLTTGTVNQAPPYLSEQIQTVMESWLPDLAHLGKISRRNGVVLGEDYKRTTDAVVEVGSIFSNASAASRIHFPTTREPRPPSPRSSNYPPTNLLHHLASQFEQLLQLWEQQARNFERRHQQSEQKATQLKKQIDLSFAEFEELEQENRKLQENVGRAEKRTSELQREKVRLEQANTELERRFSKLEEEEENRTNYASGKNIRETSGSSSSSAANSCAPARSGTTTSVGVSCNLLVPHAKLSSSSSSSEVDDSTSLFSFANRGQTRQLGMIPDHIAEAVGRASSLGTDNKKSNKHKAPAKNEDVSSPPPRIGSLNRHRAGSGDQEEPFLEIIELREQVAVAERDRQEAANQLTRVENLLIQKSEELHTANTELEGLKDQHEKFGNSRTEGNRRTLAAVEAKATENKQESYIDQEQDEDLALLRKQLKQKDRLIQGLRNVRSELLENAVEYKNYQQALFTTRGGSRSTSTTRNVKRTNHGDQHDHYHRAEQGPVAVAVSDDDEEEKSPRTRALKRQVQFFKKQALAMERHVLELEHDGDDHDGFGSFTAENRLHDHLPGGGREKKQTVPSTESLAELSSPSPSKKTKGMLLGHNDAQVLTLDENHGMKDEQKNKNANSAASSSSSTTAKTTGTGTTNTTRSCTTKSSRKPLTETAAMFQQLIAEIQTLETQKADCEGEIRRLERKVRFYEKNMGLYSNSSSAATRTRTSGDSSGAPAARTSGRLEETVNGAGILQLHVHSSARTTSTTTRTSIVNDSTKADQSVRQKVLQQQKKRRSGSNTTGGNLFFYNVAEDGDDQEQRLAHNEQGDMFLAQNAALPLPPTSTVVPVVFSPAQRRPTSTRTRYDKMNFSGATSNREVDRKIQNGSSALAFSPFSKTKSDGAAKIMLASNKTSKNVNSLRGRGGEQRIKTPPADEIRTTAQKKKLCPVYSTEEDEIKHNKVNPHEDFLSVAQQGRRGGYYVYDDDLSGEDGAIARRTQGGTREENASSKKKKKNKNGDGSNSGLKNKKKRSYAPSSSPVAQCPTQ